MNDKIQQMKEWKEQWHTQLIRVMKEQKTFLDAGGMVTDAYWAELDQLEKDYRSYIKELDFDILEKESVKLPGPGRPIIGVTKKVSITLPAEEWERIEEMKDNGHIVSLSEYFRNLHEKQVN